MSTTATRSEADAAATAVPPVRSGSWRTPRRILVVGLLAGLLLAATVVSLSLGEYPVPPGEVVRALLGSDTTSGFIVTGLRLPRALTGVAAGAAFGLAGALFQSVIRNPLASPDLVGVTAGAGVGAVAAITLAGVASVWVPVLALAGAAVAAAAVYLLAWRHGLQVPLLVLVGIGLGGTGFASGALTSLTQLMVVEAQIDEAQQATVWLAGSLHASTLADAAAPLLALAVALPLLPLAARTLRSLTLGDDLARGLGTGLGRSRLGLLGLGVLLSGTATAAAGPVGFVALGSPQIARRLSRTPAEPLVASALVGALVVTVADVVAREAFAPTSLPAGAVTAVVGAPYLLWLLTRSENA